jgi:membrane protein YqaA with SNARE-associated domain
MSSGYAIFAAQFWVLPYAALYIAGIVMALRRRDMGSASTYAAIGFVAFLAATIVSSAQMYVFTTMRESADFSPARVASYALIFSVVGNAMRLCALGFLMAAIFAKRPVPRAD